MWKFKADGNQQNGSGTKKRSIADSKLNKTGWLSKSNLILPALGVNLVICLCITIVLLAGLGGGKSESLAVMNIDASRFMRFTAPHVNLTGAVAKRHLYGRLDLDSAVKGASDGFDDLTSGDAADKVAQGAKDAKDKVSDEVGGAVDKVKDGLDGARSAVAGLVDKVLGQIETELNAFLEKAARTLSDVDVDAKYSLYVTTMCRTPRGNATANSTEPLGDGDLYGGPPVCTSLFRDDDAALNATENGGRVLGVAPGALLADALRVFLVPDDVASRARAPLDGAADGLEASLAGAARSLRSLVAHAAMLPLVLLHALAAAAAWALLGALGLEAARTLLKKENASSGGGGSSSSSKDASRRRKKWFNRVLYGGLIAVVGGCMLIAVLLMAAIKVGGDLLSAPAGVVGVSLGAGGAYVGLTVAAFLLALLEAFFMFFIDWSWEVPVFVAPSFGPDNEMRRVGNAGGAFRKAPPRQDSAIDIQSRRGSLACASPI